jgi:hypothetical protein
VLHAAAAAIRRAPAHQKGLGGQAGSPLQCRLTYQEEGGSYRLLYAPGREQNGS